jgi:hypothetical protein
MLTGRDAPGTSAQGQQTARSPSPARSTTRSRTSRTSFATCSPTWPHPASRSRSPCPNAPIRAGSWYASPPRDVCPPRSHYGVVRLIQAAISYYGTYTDEINQLIDLNDQETEEAHAAYLAGQAAVRR